MLIKKLSNTLTVETGVKNEADTLSPTAKESRKNVNSIFDGAGQKTFGATD